jgi:endonuclease/exonuclease/phosphatase family metal-dependent hydrolase
MIERRFLPTLVLLSVLAGCAQRQPPALVSALAGSCRAASVRWLLPSGSDHRARLDSWCAGVGAPVVRAVPATANPLEVAIDDVTFVSWNVHVGNGDVRTFVRDLQAGTLTEGRPVRHFVLMLQEVVRTGGVPSFAPQASGARRIAANLPDSAIDVANIAEELGLSLVYVPSMRNADSAAEPDADRGSAILSTLPLIDPTAIELPGERQRRVAIIAKAVLAPAEMKTIAVGVLHLDALGASRRLWVLGTPWMRELQTRSIAAALPEGDLVLGADLNTWHGIAEPAARHLRAIFSGTPLSGPRQRPGMRVLDYLFFRAGNRSAHYDVISNDYGSDHRPLIGRVTICSACSRGASSGQPGTADTPPPPASRTSGNGRAASSASARG